jgi:hypothetical protein
MHEQENFGRGYFEEVELKDARRTGFIDGVALGVAVTLILALVAAWLFGVHNWRELL